jgi:uncharacterized membrane protein
MKNNLRLLIYTALMTAFVFITTSLIKIPIPFTNGYIHAGDMSIFIAGILLGPLHAAFAAGVGSALADFLGGYAHWVIPTLIIKSLMGLLIGYLSKPSTKTKPYLVAAIAIWVTALAVFIFTITQIGIEQIGILMELPTTADAVTLVDSIKTQLLSVLIGFPVLSLLLWYFKRHFKLSMNQLISMIISGIWMVLGYFIAGGLMYGNFVTSIFSVPWNIVQFGVGGILAFLVVKALDKANINYDRLRH